MSPLNRKGAAGRGDAAIDADRDQAARLDAVELGGDEGQTDHAAEAVLKRLNASAACRRATCTRRRERTGADAEPERIRTQCKAAAIKREAWALRRKASRRGARPSKLAPYDARPLRLDSTRPTRLERSLDGLAHLSQKTGMVPAVVLVPLDESWRWFSEQSVEARGLASETAQFLGGFAHACLLNMPMLERMFADLASAAPER